MHIDDALSLIREIPDYPKPGIRFLDITPLLSNSEAFSAVTKSFSSYAEAGTLVAGVEARGFILASALAHQLNSGFIPIRKAGKLPYATLSESYGLEYGTDTLEIHVDALGAGDKVLIVDDVLATGGTIAAAIELVRRCGGEVVGVLALLEIGALTGREFLENKYPEITISTLIVS